MLIRDETKDKKKNRAHIISMIVVWFISCTWGAIMGICGIAAMVVLMCKGYRPKGYRGFVFFEVGKNWGGINLGPVFIVNQNASDHILKHELGHGIQNLAYGIFMPFLVGIPSVSRAKWRQYVRATDYPKYLTLPKYEDVWFEKQATKWGYWFCGLKGNLGEN